MSTTPRQLSFGFEPDFSTGPILGPVAGKVQPKLTRPKLDDPRAIFTWQPPAPAEFSRLMADDARATA